MNSFAIYRNIRDKKKLDGETIEHTGINNKNEAAQYIS